MKRKFILVIILTSILIGCKSQKLDFSENPLNGEYIGIGKANAEIELKLLENKKFKFWIRKGHSADFTQGTWKASNDTLILNSKALNGTDSLTYALSSATWIEFKNLKWKINNNRPTVLENEKWKLKKETE